MKYLISTVFAVAFATTAAAETIKIGVLTDMSGPLSDYSGPGSALAARMAVEDFAKENSEITVEIVTADTQNKADVAGSIGRRWFDQEEVDVIVDVPGSAIVLALSQIALEKNKVILSTSSSSSRITGSECSPNTLNWTYSTWALANGTGRAVVEQGGDSWFFLTQDQEYGRDVQAATTRVIEASGGTVLGSVNHPLGVADFSSYLLQAQASGAKVIGLASAAADTINAIKQANEFGIVVSGQKLATLVLFITDVHALGLNAAQGLQSTTAFYWDMNDDTRAFAERFADAHNGAKPSQVQAAVYSSVLAYLRSAGQLGSAEDGKAVLAGIREIGWFEDPLFGNSRLRADGTVEHAMYLAEVKSPERSQGPWDYYEILQTIPAEEAFQPESETNCPLNN
ncbi:ABC transporter substrate-binding protein [Fertoebacter nigrum]|uniref:ABC transporter substrate-binding protein n=1 Tax=Fertoeibacter niger TaxID=2656921 RepID=A0A8X8H131_9RHOB|nr:ABC transporter substrate-binding protein [Fertoeibacter niger]NUB45025.1 ABC transporter substrate-binding protein [Fertoeibacter niger]